MKDFEFGRPTMEPRWQQGLGDARRTLRTSPWLAPIPSELGVRVFDVTHDQKLHPCGKAAVGEVAPTE